MEFLNFVYPEWCFPPKRLTVVNCFYSLFSWSTSQIDYVNSFMEDYGNSGLEDALRLCYSNCGPSITCAVTWKSGRNAQSWANSRPTKSEQVFLTPSLPQIVCTLKVEEHCCNCCPAYLLNWRLVLPLQPCKELKVNLLYFCTLQHYLYNTCVIQCLYSIIWLLNRIITLNSWSIIYYVNQCVVEEV